MDNKSKFDEIVEANLGEDIDYNANFWEVSSVDSLEVSAFLMSLEVDFQIYIPADVFQKCNTLTELYDAVSEILENTETDKLETSNG